MKYDFLIVSTSCSKQMYDIVSSARIKSSLDPAQRVFNTLAKELKALGNSVTCITAVPYSRNNVSFDSFERTEEMIDGIRYIYPGFRMKPIKRILDIRNNGAKEIRQWIKKKSKYKKILICDSLVIPLCSEARKLCKMNGIRTYAYVTDYPSMATNIKTSNTKNIKSLVQRLFDAYANFDIKWYDGYIVVAKKLIELIKPKINNYIVIEDLAEIPQFCNREIPKNESFTIVYGGALCERFGINKLVDAVCSIPSCNIKMIFYGSGESVEYIKDKGKMNHRIVYGGVVSYDELQDIQKKADLLINPRPSNEVFSAYSFPSKTTSYMITGTPVLTTRIPGIPSEYYPYLLFFQDESIVGMSARITDVVNTSSIQLYEFGRSAFYFLKDNKGSKKQILKLMSFITNEKEDEL